ncbi:MAG: S1 family peptidase [Myxococcota bacterium]
MSGLAIIAVVGGLLGTEHSIYGGHDSASCAWPTVAYAEGCTGTLIAPDLVLLAAHCPPPDVIKFADHLKAQPPEAHYATVDRCQAHPGYAADLPGHDIAFCLLDEPIDFLPIIPVAAGCENAAAVPGATVTLVGFGRDERGEQGPKREVEADIRFRDNGELFIGGDGHDTCLGDSGGPAVIEVADGTWRQVAITSHGDGCGDGGYYTELAPHLDWLEQQSGRDVTPCHDPDGQWNPGPSCEQLAIAPQTGGDRWSRQCQALERSGPSASCGPPQQVPTPAGCATGGQSGTGAMWLLLLVGALSLAISSRRMNFLR